MLGAMLWGALLPAAAALHEHLSRGAVVKGVATAAAASAFGLAPRAARADVSPLDSTSWPLDPGQFSNYDASRTLLYDTKAGSYMPSDPAPRLAAALRRASADAAAPPRVIFAGEEHTNPLHHVYQLQLIKAVNELDDAPLALGLEMFYRQHQPYLDEYIFGDGDFKRLKRRCHWSKTWGYDFNDYAKILAYARKHQIRLVGLNVPYPLVSMVGTYGLRGVPPELR